MYGHSEVYSLSPDRRNEGCEVIVVLWKPAGSSSGGSSDTTKLRRHGTSSFPSNPLRRHRNMSWSSSIADISGSHRVQLALTAVLSACLAASAVVGLQNARRLYDIHDLKDSIPGLDQPHDIEKINKFGGAVPGKTAGDDEDGRSLALAARARLGDYDEGACRLLPISNDNRVDKL